MGVINRKIDPNRKMLRQHPYDVWRVLYALRLRELALGEDHTFYSPEDIARVLYTNFDDLRPQDRERVLSLKLDCPLRCLKNSCFAEEEKIKRDIRDRFGSLIDIAYDGQNRYRARSNVFNIAGWRRSSMLESTRSSLDDTWGIYIGRRGAVDRYLRYSG
jgi:hypothetical protein